MTGPRGELVSYLKERKGEWVSGESLSRMLGISRAAIWKQINRLKGEGYGISSSPKKGYLFRDIPDLLLPEEIMDGIRTIILGRKGVIHHYHETDSTNTRARELAVAGAPEGTVVISEMQTGGKGRLGRQWFSPAREGIYLSLILRPAISPAEAPGLTLLLGVAMAEALRAMTDLKVTIKWPNDLLVGGRKIGGILTELSTEMDAVNYVVAGIGLNVNVASFPEELQEIATSILVETGCRQSRIVLVRECLQGIEKHYLEFRKRGLGPVIERWKQLSEIMGSSVEVKMLDRKLRGTAVEIDRDGALILKDRHGALHRIFSGEIFQAGKAK